MMPVKQKHLYLIVFIVLVMLTLTLLSIPCVHSVETVDVSQISHYKVLDWAYQDLCAEHSLYEVVPDKNIQIVTFRNLWCSWKRYILPCFAVDIPDVPTAGNADFVAYSCVLAPWAQENLFTLLCPLTFGLNVILEPGENVFVSSFAETIPNNGVLHDGTVIFSNGMNVNKQQEVFVHYTVGTAASAEQRDQKTSSTIRWEYFLKINRNYFGFGTMEIVKHHIVND